MHVAFGNTLIDSSFYCSSVVNTDPKVNQSYTRDEAWKVADERQEARVAGDCDKLNNHEHATNGHADKGSTSPTHYLLEASEHGGQQHTWV